MFGLFRKKSEWKLLKNLHKDFEAEYSNLKLLFSEYNKKLRVIKDLINQLEDKKRWISRKLLKSEFAKLRNLVRIDQNTIEIEKKYTFKIIEIIDEILENESNFELLERESSLKNQFSKSGLSLLHIIALEIDLIEEIERTKITPKFMKANLMRLLEYVKQEGVLIGKSEEYVKHLSDKEEELDQLGHTYLESNINKYNQILVFSRKLGEDKEGELYGTKGVGIVYRNNTVDIKFLTETEAHKHAHALRILLEGIPKERLTMENRLQYITGKSLSTLSKIAGFQLQAKKYFSTGEIKITGIRWDSQITEVQIRKQVPIKTVDLERLNYALLFSIDKDLLDKSKFRETISRRGNKIEVQFLQQKMGKWVNVKAA
jgi:hypothetical protein